MDDILPAFTPDWDNPKPYDAPSPEETAMFGQLRATADAIRAWLTGAYLMGVNEESWLALAARLNRAGQDCIDMTRTVTGEIEGELDAAKQEGLGDHAGHHPEEGAGR